MEQHQTSNGGSHVYANGELTSARERPVSQFSTTPEHQPVRPPLVTPRVAPPVAKKPKPTAHPHQTKQLPAAPLSQQPSPQHQQQVVCLYTTLLSA